MPEIDGQATPAGKRAPSRPAKPKIHSITESVTPGQPLELPALETLLPTPSESDGPVMAPGAAEMGISWDNISRSGPKIRLADLLSHLVFEGGSDLHLQVGAPPMMRLNGDMRPIPDQAVLTNQSLKEAIYDILSEPQKKQFEQDWELDLAYTLPNVSRFRVNIMRQRHNLGAVFRVVPTEIKPLETLGLPQVLNSLSNIPRGLVLVTGPTGSGKSTTLASLIDRANRTRSGHIITIEDPIEFIHTHGKSVVTQREVGTDTVSFEEALKHVLRQDPDIILIGELRDLETISIALTAAETGHLVFATLHTQSAQDTISRVIDVFPANQQGQIRSQLAATLKAVVCQTLVKRADGRGRVPAVEIMMVNSAIATMIRRNDIHQIPAALQAGGAMGMQTLNQHLSELVARNMITRETAEEHTTDSTDLAALIEGTKTRKSGPGGGLKGSSI